MKDYYYILGVSRNATEAEIKIAYKKLSLKFHPDKNLGDKFFEDRFKEVQEAHEILSNPLKRANYNALLEPRMAREHLARIDTNPPMITTFETSKKSIREGDPITLRWQTVHANEVEIDYIGKVDSAGSKTIRLPMINNKEKIVIQLIANNTFIQKKIKKRITIKNRSYNERQAQLLYGEDEGVELATDNEDEEAETSNIENHVFEEEKEKEVEKESNIKTQLEGETATQKETVAKNLTKAEYLESVEAIFTENDNEERGFRWSDIYIYIVVVMLLIFITIMSVYVYQINPL